MAAWSKEVFAKNLRRYMEERGKNQKELAEIVGVSATALNDWLKAKKYPRIDKIEILANYFGCLKSDLIEDNKKPVERKMYSSEEIGLLIKEKRLAKGMTQAQLGEKVGFSANTVARWEKGTLTNLRQNTMQSLADVLGVSPLNLIGFTVEETERAEKKKLQHEEWEKRFGNIDFSDKEFMEIINFIEFLLSKRVKNNNEE